MKQKNQNINHEVLQSLSDDMENKSLVCLIGANMSGKSTLINKLRQEANSKTEIIFAVRIDRTINNIIFSSGESEFRINDISPFVSNIMKETCKLDPTLSSIDVGEFYNQVIKDVNIFIKEF
jgi:ATPase subunit of ABC transporter with duplicated ATPase domains